LRVSRESGSFCVHRLQWKRGTLPGRGTNMETLTGPRYLKDIVIVCRSS
jgi:hypothetical protein